jgi:twitching motility two-component system response regulator PilG
MTLDSAKNKVSKAVNSSTQNDYDIFVVDDNFDQANIIKLLIEQSGFKANFTTDSEAAYQTIIKDKPRLVILDLMMPELDGLKLLKMIKENPDTQHVKIIIYSGKLYDSDRRKAFMLGADIFLTKPTRSQVLMDSIRSLLDTNGNEIMPN